MAKGHTLNPGYESGSHWAECERCTFDRRKEDLTQEWNGRWVCKDGCYEKRHPQDLIRVRGDEQAVNEPINPPDTTNTVSVTFAETFTVPEGTNNNEL